jgi:hypothetical protein
MTITACKAFHDACLQHALKDPSESSSCMHFRLLVAKPQVKNGLSWLVVRGNAARLLFRVQKTTVNDKTFTDVFFSMIASDEVW